MTPTGEEVLEVVRGAVVTVLEVEPTMVTRDTSFADLHADSLALVEIVEIIEETLAPRASAASFHIDDEDLDSITTVGEAVDYALARL